MAGIKLEFIKFRNVSKTHNSVSGVLNQVDDYYKHIDAIAKAGEERIKEIAQERREASRLVSLANKRVKRLEEKGLTDAPAYQQYIKEGGKKFGIRGKNYNEVQAELARLRRFINSGTSTIRGVNKYVKRMAEVTGMEYKDLKDLRAKAPKFFELQSKVEQYLRDVEDIASAIDYKQIWEGINTYVQTAKIDLSKSNADIESMIEGVTKAIKGYEKPVTVGGSSVRLKNI